MNAEFFDMFSVLGFIILLIVGIKLSKRKNKRVKWSGIIISIISIIGLIVDLYIVFTNHVFK